MKEKNKNSQKETNQDIKSLSAKTPVKIRFNEVDPLGIVWHGHHIQYFENGREAFGEAFGLSYMDFYKNGFVVPIVSINCDYKRPIKYMDDIVVEAIYIDNPAAKIFFNYRIFNQSTNELLAEGNSVQVFLSSETRELQLSVPDFFLEWKEKHII